VNLDSFNSSTFDFTNFESVVKCGKFLNFLNNSRLVVQLTPKSIRKVSSEYGVCYFLKHPEMYNMIDRIEKECNLDNSVLNTQFRTFRTKVSQNVVYVNEQEEDCEFEEGSEFHNVIVQLEVRPYLFSKRTGLTLQITQIMQLEQEIEESTSARRKFIR
jgi:hypothetical protein